MKGRGWVGLVGWAAVTFAAAWFGSRYPAGAWYVALEKPAWTPPSALFAPVWTALYALMAIAAWLVWKRAGFAGAPAALGLFLGQLVLNAAWSWLFFGLRRPDLALFELVLLWVAILCTTALFWRHRTAAGVLMLPYAAWVAYAGALNLAIWRLNAAAAPGAAM